MVRLLRRPFLGVTIVIALAVTMTAGLYLFRRTEQIAGSAKEERVVGTYRWGRLHKVQVDDDHDGVFEWEIILDKGEKFSDFEAWDPLEERFDADGDGMVDAYTRRIDLNGGSTVVYLFDTDGDGVLDTSMLGNDGKDYLSEHLRTKEKP